VIKPPRKLPVLKPRLLPVKRMTIALGILAGGGVVMAADRQETTGGTFKGSVGKVHAHWVRNQGTLAVSGAGDGPYIDSLHAEIVKWFKQDRTSPITEQEMEDELRRLHQAFYRDNVLPASQWPQNDVPDYDLLVAFSSPWHGNALWTTHKLSVVKESEYAAVGIGATAAKSMLNRLGFPFMELEIAVTLAAYIVYQVKRTIDMVGLDTDIFEIRNHVPLVFSRQELTEMEAQFRTYENVERDNLFYYLGGDLSNRENVIGKPGGHSHAEKSLREFFMAWNERRRNYLRRQPPVPGESTPQNPEPGQ
jgi:hypothetical protein